jgi:cell division protease FtsH
METSLFLDNQIMMALGGIEAERLIFGPDNIGIGAVSDLQKATSIALKKHKQYGMYNNKFLVTSTPDSQLNNSHIHIDGVDQQVVNLINTLTNEVRKCLEDNKDLLIELSTYLFNNSKIKHDQIIVLLKKSSPNLLEGIKTKENYFDHFKDFMLLK